MKLSLERKIALGLALSCAAMLLVAGAAIWNVRWLQGTFYWVDHTHSVLNRLESALNDVLTMQTSTRGFVLTGDDAILRPYQAGATRLPETFAALQKLLADNPPQLARLRDAEQAAKEAQVIMRGRIAAREARGLASAGDTPEFLNGQTAVEKFRAQIEAMKVAEQGLLDNRFVRTRQAVRATGFAIAGATAVTLAAIGLAIFFVRRDFIRRRHAEAERDCFFEVTRDLLCIANFHGYFVRVNPAWEETFGFTPAEMQATPFLDFVHPDDREMTLREAARLSSGLETVLFENRYRCRDGSYRWLSWNARPVVDRQLIVCNGRDITERKISVDRIRQLNGDLEARARQLEAVNGELEAFSYSVSHDLRAPLRHVDGFSNLLLKRARESLDPESLRYVETISRAAKQMGTLVDDLLAFSRLGRTPLRSGSVAHGELVAEVVAELRERENARTIDWQIGPLIDVQADPAMLRQVWRNLLENAVKYSSKSLAPRIVVASSDDVVQGERIFSVSDNGVGFDMAYADKLFGVFQRLHGPTEFEGTGIGLANVRRIINRHGGRTWAQARLNEGATFYFSLPLSPTTTAASPT